MDAISPSEAATHMEKKNDKTLRLVSPVNAFYFFDSIRSIDLTSCRRGRGSHRSPARSQSRSKWPPTSPSGRCIARPRPAGRIASGAPAHGPAGQDVVPHPWFLRTMRSRWKQKVKKKKRKKKKLFRRSKQARRVDCAGYFFKGSVDGRGALVAITTDNLW